MEQLGEDPKYHISIDRSKGLIDVSVRGIWDLDDGDRYQRVRDEAIRQCHQAAGRALILIDMREFAVQPPAIFQQSYRPSLLLCAEKDKCAYVVSSALLKLQLDRIVSSHARRTFTSRAEAQAWLTDTAKPKA